MDHFTSAVSFPSPSLKAQFYKRVSVILLQCEYPPSLSLSFSYRSSLSLCPAGGNRLSLQRLRSSRRFMLSLNGEVMIRPAQASHSPIHTRQQAVTITETMITTPHKSASLFLMGVRQRRPDAQNQIQTSKGTPKVCAKTAGSSGPRVNAGCDIRTGTADCTLSLYPANGTPCQMCRLSMTTVLALFHKNTGTAPSLKCTAVVRKSIPFRFYDLFLWRYENKAASMGSFLGELLLTLWSLLF